MDRALRKGLALLEQRDYRAVHTLAIGRIQENPHDPAPYHLLARVAQDHGNVVKADELNERAAKLGHGDPFYVASYGQYLLGRGRQHEALICAHRCAALATDNAFVADMVGVIFSRTGFHEHAVPLFELAVRLDPAPANFHYNLGASRQFSGDFEGAKSAFRATIERQPDAYRAYSSLVALSRQTLDDNLLDDLKALFARNAEDPDAALHFGHAIAKTLEDLGEHAASLEWLGKAKKRKRASLDYSIDDDLALFDAAGRATQSTAIHTAVHSDAAPIFIIGLPRTGTTLVDRILSSHPEVVSAGELNTFAGLIKNLAKTPSNRVLDVETLQNTPGADLAALGHDYIHDTQHLARGAARFTDKMPLNFFYAGLIHRALPNARIVALRRDPMDSCLSNYRQLFSTAFSYYNYSFDLADSAQYYLAFDALMRHWRDTLPTDRFLQIRYEDIVADLEREARRLLEFCDLEWNDACLRFHENAAPVSTASSVQVRSPVYSSSVGRWEKYGNALDDLKRQLDAVL